jgi:uncharacterized protein YjbI with pentapeptide repeats
MIETIGIILGFAGTLFTGYMGYRKYLDEKQFTYFRENIKNLFVKNKDELLASIAILGVYKNRKEYKKSTIDTLSNLLYTELDYDISNAIIGVLTQASELNELTYIVEKLIEINRNFFVQSYPLQSRQNDLKAGYEGLSGAYSELIEGKTDSGKLLTDTEAALKEKWIKYKNMNDFELKWHKLATADVLAMILNKADKLNLSKNLKLDFYQNDFNYCQFAGLHLNDCSMRHSAMSTSLLFHIAFINLIINNSTFSRSSIQGCSFSGGEITSTSFINATFENVTFENTIFRDTFFFGATLRDCTFKNTKGLTSLHFYNCKFPQAIQFIPPLLDNKVISYDEVVDLVTNSGVTNYRKNEILGDLAKMNSSKIEEESTA